MSTETLAGALAEVQAHLPMIAKTETATVRSDKGSYSYSYANLAQVSHAILPLLGKAGLAWITKPTLNAEGKMVLSYRLLHVSGESEAGEYPLPTTGTPQQIGSAITYARRYTLCSVTGVAPEQDDDDAASASMPSARPGGSKPVQRQRKPEPASAPEGQGGRTVRRSAAPAAGPPLPGEEPSSDLRSDAQSKMMHTLFGQLGLGRDDALAYVAGTVEREVGSTKELTKGEASRVIESLSQDVGARSEESPGDLPLAGDEDV